MSLQLQLEDLQDQSHRNNVRIRGVPEPVEQEDLQDTVKCIFQKVMKDSMPLNYKMDTGLWAPSRKIAAVPEM